jgi:AcrR family transcriptional regulator
MKRPYVMTARAEAAEATAERIFDAALVRFMSAPYDEVRLADIATDAGVTVQTVFRRFGSKEGLLRAMAEVEQAKVAAERSGVLSGDVPAAVENLLDHYERIGDTVLHVLRQEHRVPVFAEITTFGRTVHLEWCQEVFASHLQQVSGVDRERLLAQLVAICDVYTWFLLRRQRGLSRRQTALALTEILEGLLK